LRDLSDAAVMLQPMDIEDIASIRDEDGWRRVSCDAAGCTAEHDIRLGEPLHDGWTQRAEASGLTSAGGRHYRCPRHGDS
jgi:hypothetical protein